MGGKDDFKNDDLIAGKISHRTNLMFMQPKKWIRKVFGEPHKAVETVRGKVKTDQNFIIIINSFISAQIYENSAKNNKL